ncbi:sensor histidine kinase [Caldicoprobacter algeriensis]|uniref:sensor histidine kinase n=1 Tax=Caldicoprobacter algeriensis TaxID=699281 RepID=UPI0020799645|nr:sensor histidine kinase [Caldicoprobacter algeriensis]MCM8900531.1 sensor histidine kinase [Caldicoprobacter algeriensis]
MSIRNKLIYSIILFVILPMFFIPIIVYDVYESILESKINASTQQTLSQLASNISAVIDNLIAASNMLSLDKELIDILKKEDYVSEWEEFYEKSKIIDKLANAKNSVLYPYDTDIIIFDLKGNNIYSSTVYGFNKKYDDIKNQYWFKKTINMNGYMFWMSPLGRYIDINNFCKNNIAMARLIKGDKSLGGYGVLLISLYPQSKLVSMFKTVNLPEGTRLFLVDEKGTIILTDNLSMIGHSLGESYLTNIESSYSGSLTMNINGEKMVINYHTIPKVNWKVIQVTPYDALMKEVGQLWSYNILINSLFVTILMIISILLSTAITRPLHRLSLLMKEISKGNFNIEAPVNGNDEVSQLSKTFNIMVKEIDRLIKQLEEEHKMRERMYFETLQMQINPHFLFNALNGIKWMAIIKGENEIGRMITALGKLLETTLSKNGEIIPLLEEIQCIDSYVLLQKMRYGDKFDIRYNIDETILSYKVPRLILQPLVENAIIHGFEDMESRGVITINGYKQSNLLFIEVVDNGKGMSSEKIDQILKGLQKNNKFNNNIGLKNVNDRIKLYFGVDYGLVIHSEEGKGTVIQICLPLSQKGDHQ